MQYHALDLDECTVEERFEMRAPSYVKHINGERFSLSKAMTNEQVFTHSVCFF